MKIKKVTVIFKTHLDVGFTDLASNVVKRYFDTFIVNAVKTADHFRKNHKDKRYVWTVGSWLIYEYLERGTPKQKKFLEDAIKRGDIVWHALPFTTHSELADESLYRYGISLSSELDARFGKKTVAAKMTDVPGHTRGIIAPLVEAGIKFMHIGVNPASAVPDVPALSRWKDSRGNSIILAYQKDYGDTFSVSGSDSICHVAVTGDNLGPHTPEEAEKVYAMLEEKYAGAKIVAGSFNDMYASVKSVEKSLPVIENEIGDSWIHGTGTDPLKVARFKELCRLRNKWLDEKPSIASKKEFKDFSRALLQITEHTWGLDEKKTIKGEKACRGEAFKEFRKTAGAKRFEKSWAEKRAIIKTAVSALKSENLRKEALVALRSVSPRFPDFSKLKSLKDFSFETAFLKGSFDPKSGAVNLLVLKKGKLVIADEKHPLGLFSAQTYSLDSYARFRSQYLRLDLEWAILDFTKPYIPASVKEKNYTASKLKFYSKKAVGADIVIAHLLMPSKADSGMPEELAIEYRFPHEKPEIEVKVNWKNKEVARLPHGLWFSFMPLQDKKSSWTFSKLGEPVAPDSVISKGGKTLHSVSGEILCKSGKNSIKFESLDAPLVSPGKPSLLDFSSKNPDMQGGIHYNLYNNIWGTNFPMWYGDDGQFRFRISFS